MPLQMLAHFFGDTSSNTGPISSKKGKRLTLSRLLTLGGQVAVYKGVTLDKGRWRATIKANGKRISLGMYDIEAKAAQAYDIAALRYFKQYALTMLCCFLTIPL
jgi:AP2 domain